MRNILKPAARTASSRARRSVRGAAAVVASVALAAGLGSYPVDAQETSAETTTSATAETVASATTEAETPTSSQTSSAAPKPVVAEPNTVTVERDGDVDHITIRDTDDNPWDSGRKASDEYIWGVKRTGDGDITRIVTVVADGEELDPQYFGYVNGEEYDVIGIDEDAFWTIPPMKLEIEVETTDAGEYEIAEPDEVPTARELSETGYGRTDQAAATVNPEGVGMARAAAPGNIPGVPGEQDQELNLSSPKAEWVNNNPQLQFKVNESGSWRMTRFAVKKDKNDTNEKDITGPVRIRVIRSGATVVDRMVSPEMIFWGTNSKGKSFDTEFQLIPKITDLFIRGGDTVILNPAGPPNGTYRIQMWGQNLDQEPQEHKATVTGNGVPVSRSQTVGRGPYETTATIDQRSNVKSVSVTLSPAVNLNDVYLEMPVEKSSGSPVKLAREVKTFSDRVEITWYPTKDGVPIESVTVGEDTTLTIRTSYRSKPTRNEEWVINGSLAGPRQPGDKTALPILPIAESDVPPVTDGGRCELRNTAPVKRQPPRDLTQPERDFGFRRFIVASPTSGGDRASSQLYLEYEEEAGDLKLEKIGPKSGWVYNALAYNESDNYLYAVSEPRIGLSSGHRQDPCFPAGHLLQINPYTGEVFDLGALGIKGYLPEVHQNDRPANDLGSGVNSGAFDSDGNYWVSAASVWGSGRLYKIDLEKVAASLPNSAEVTAGERWEQLQRTYRTVSEDLVAIPGVSGYLWGLQSGWASRDRTGEDRIFLERVSLTGGAPMRLDITDYKLPSGETLGSFLGLGSRAPVWGQAWVEPDGSLAFGKGGGSVQNQHTTDVVTLKVDSPTSRPSGWGVHLVGTKVAPTSYNTDGTSAPGSVNPTRTPPKVFKEVVGEGATANADGSYSVRYRVTVSAPSSSAGAVYDEVVDRPQMSQGVHIVGARWTMTNEFGEVGEPISQTGAGPYILSGGGEIRPEGISRFGKTSNGTHVFELEMVFNLQEPVSYSNNGRCEPGNGLFNSVEVGPNKSEACTPPPKDEPQSYRFRLAKVSSEDVFGEGTSEEMTMLQSAEFRLFALDASGKVEKDFELAFKTETGLYEAETLAPGKYRLVETKAPIEDGIEYNLLVRPIEFEIKSDGTVGLGAEASAVAWQIDAEDVPANWAPSGQDVFLAVANVRKGNLPKTGGVGLQLPILVGGALIAAGALMGRRKAAA